MLMRSVYAALLCLSLTSLPSHGQPAAQNAATSAGTVKRLAGQVTLERAGARNPVSVGATVHAGDTVRTGADGSVGITLADDTLLTLGADSELVLDNYSFDTTTHDGGLLMSLWRGTVGVVTGLIGRKAPENLRFQTCTVVLGVRGTEFIIDARGAAR
jgi:hypothetical protein